MPQYVPPALPFKTLHFSHRVYLYVPYKSQNKQVSLGFDGSGLDLSGLRHVPVADSCEYNSETSGCLKNIELLDQLCDCNLLRALLLQ
jgi:hypothetical protein